MKSNLHLKMAENATGLVPIIELLDRVPPVRRFVGVKMKRIDINGQERYEFLHKEEGDIVKYHPDYVKAVRQGVLVPMNEETARICKVDFKQNETKPKRTRRLKKEEEETHDQ